MHTAGRTRHTKSFSLYTMLRVPSWKEWPERADAEMISAISYTPDEFQINMLWFKSAGTITDTGCVSVKPGVEFPMTTRTVFFDIPSLIDRIKTHPEESFFVMKDRHTPFSCGEGHATMGPNLLLKRFDDKTFGIDRFNLFQYSFEQVRIMLAHVMDFRQRNEMAILGGIVEDLRIDSNLPQPLVSPGVVQMLELCYRSGRNLQAMGIGLRSFCQTWDMDSGLPNFSVASPHFQTRVYVSDASQLYAFLSGLQYPDCSPALTIKEIDVMFWDYSVTVGKLQAAFIAKGYSNKFVDLDMMFKSWPGHRMLS